MRLSWFGWRSRYWRINSRPSATIGGAPIRAIRVRTPGNEPIAGRPEIHQDQEGHQDEGGRPPQGGVGGAVTPDRAIEEDPLEAEDLGGSPRDGEEDGASQEMACRHAAVEGSPPQFFHDARGRGCDNDQVQRRQERRGDDRGPPDTSAIPCPATPLRPSDATRPASTASGGSRAPHRP